MSTAKRSSRPVKKTVKMIDAALEWSKKGYPVFPCRHTGDRAKQPLVKGGFKSATTDPKQIHAWWTKWPDALIGLPTGEPSGIDVLDIDTKNGVDGFAAIPDWKSISPVRVRTTSGGAHLYFRRGETLIKNSAGKNWPGDRRPWRRWLRHRAAFSTEW